MAKVGVELTPESKRTLEKLAKVGKVDFRPVFNTIAIGYRKEVEAIFNKKQPKGQGLSWKPLSEKYAAWKSKNYPGQPLLVRTGDLKASMIKQGEIGNITLINKLNAILGSSIPYGIFHDEGTKKTPKRNFSEPSERRLGIFEKEVNDYVVHLFQQEGINVDKGIFN